MIAGVASFASLLVESEPQSWEQRMRLIPLLPAEHISGDGIGFGEAKG
ncbi:hypothetical protein [Paenibacillus albus]|nr:hypothetical protein [Paenibacillus albus]